MLREDKSVPNAKTAPIERSFFVITTAHEAVDWLAQVELAEDSRTEGQDSETNNNLLNGKETLWVTKNDKKLQITEVIVIVEARSGLHVPRW